MKVFISQPMSDISEENVTKQMNRIKKELERWCTDVEIIDNYHHPEPPDNSINPRLWYLGESIKQMCEADLVYFVYGYKQAKGCLIEKEICEKYNLNYYAEGFMPEWKI